MVGEHFARRYGSGRTAPVAESIHQAGILLYIFENMDSAWDPAEQEL